MSTVQRTLDGGEADEDQRERPDTLRWCHHCEEWVLRSRFDAHWQHDYDAQEADASPDEDGEDEDEDGDEELEQIGAWYDITLEYTTTYRFRVPAWSEHRAEEVAKDWHWDASPADAHHLHTDRREIKPITTADVPEDFDQYGSEPLHEAVERMNEEATENGGKNE